MVRRRRYISESFRGAQILQVESDLAGFGDGSGVLGGVIAEMVEVAYSEGHPGFHLRLRAILGWVKSLED